MRRSILLLIIAGLLAACGAPGAPSAGGGAQQSSPVASTATPTAPTPRLDASATAVSTTAAEPSATAAEPTATALPTNTAAPSATATALARENALTGSVSYPAEPALPPGAVLTLKLKTGLLAFDYPEWNEVLGEQRISPIPAGPVPFAIALPPDKISPDGYESYKLVAEVEAAGKRIFTGGAVVLEEGKNEVVSLQLHPLPSSKAIHGTVSYKPRLALPPDAELLVQLTTPTDGVGGPTVLGEQRISPVGEANAFDIPIDPAKIDPFGVYAISAHVTAPGRLPSWAEEPVLTYGAPSEVNITLKAHEARGIKGTALLPEQEDLGGAVLSVQLVSLYEGLIGTLVHGHAIKAPRAGANEFLIEYRQESIYAVDAYAMYASVRRGERLLYTSPLISLDSNALPESIDLQLQPPANVASVSGSISLGAGQTLPAGTKLLVQLADMSYVGGDGEPIVLAEQSMTLAADGSAGFAIEYDPLTIRGNTPYAILVTAGKLYASQPVITEGHPTELTIVLE